MVKIHSSIFISFSEYQALRKKFEAIRKDIFLRDMGNAFVPIEKPDEQDYLNSLFSRAVDEELDDETDRSQE